jgi:hypothetical protein
VNINALQLRSAPFRGEAAMVPMTKILLAPLALSALLFSVSSCSASSSAAVAVATEAGTETLGGLVEGTKILRVTSLADDGPGSLRAAVETAGPRVIVFDVSGVIKLDQDLAIRNPAVTLAGQTAPSPGITLIGAALRIRTHDVVVQHIAVRPGASLVAKVNDNLDAISVDGNPNGGPKQYSQDVRIENVSVSWSVDEALSLWYPTTRRVSITSSIVAEALSNAGHPKGPHSMGLLVGTNVQGAEIAGNLFLSNSFRNPAIHKGSSAYVANNLIVNPGWNAIHFYAKGADAPLVATVIDNVIEVGPSTRKALAAIHFPDAPGEAIPADKVYIAENITRLGPEGKPLVLDARLPKVTSPPIAAKDWKLRPAEAVRAYVLRFAGSRPSDRNAVDRRMLREVQEGNARIVDSPPEVVAERSETREARVPANPLQIQPGTTRTRLDIWLCEEHFAVGGAETARCPNLSPGKGT